MFLSSLSDKINVMLVACSEYSAKLTPDFAVSEIFDGPKGSAVPAEGYWSFQRHPWVKSIDECALTQPVQNTITCVERMSMNTQGSSIAMA